MKVIKRVNVSGTMKSLKVNEAFSLPRPEYKPSMIRAAASRVTADTGKQFSVNLMEKATMVTRVL